jgi:hypothetical protein
MSCLIKKSLKQIKRIMDSRLRGNDGSNGLFESALKNRFA